MKKTTLLAVVAMICLNFGLHAQVRKLQHPYVSIGSLLPDSVWNMRLSTLNGPTNEIYLKDSKGKLILLDFWATWCTACVRKFPALDSLQAQFADRIQIYLINAGVVGDTPEKIMKRLNGHSIVSIVNAAIFKKLFPHIYIPHYVWIDEKGKVIAYSSEDMVNASMINSILSANHVKAK